MILSEVRDYVRKRGKVSLADVAQHFGTEPEAVRPMLDKWVSKGKIHPVNAAGACGSGCCQCSSAALEVYAWGEPSVASAPTRACDVKVIHGPF